MFEGIQNRDAVGADAAAAHFCAGGIVLETLLAVRAILRAK